MVSGQSESLPGGAGCSSYRHGGLDRSRRGLGVQLRYVASVVCAQHKLLKLHNAVEIRVPGDCDPVYRDGNLNTRLHLEVTPTAR